jgi:hypothetical protein
MEDVIQLHVAEELRKSYPGFTSQTADDFEIKLIEEDLQEKWRKEVIRSAVRTISSVSGPHPIYVWEAAAHWDTETLHLPFVESCDDWCAPYLKCFGFAPLDAEHWSIVPATGGSEPTLHFDIASMGHEEQAGHTWYMIECGLLPRGSAPVQSLANDNHGIFEGLRWMAPRRLLHVREMVQQHLMASMDDDYATKFEGAPFPLRMAPPGTTARLNAWLKCLAHHINVGALKPQIVAWVLVHFLPYDGRRLAELNRLLGNTSDVFMDMQDGHGGEGEQVEGTHDRSVPRIGESLPHMVDVVAAMASAHEPITEVVSASGIPSESSVTETPPLEKADVEVVSVNADIVENLSQDSLQVIVDDAEEFTAAPVFSGD